MSVNRWYEPERPTEPPELEDYRCPNCGVENPEYYFVDDHGNVLGCDVCIMAIDAAQWEYDRRLWEERR